jgi:non-specific serine/threonine protein kinase
VQLGNFEKFTIVYNLYRVDNYDIVLPNAFICVLDKNNLPRYVRALALENVVESYGIGVKDTPHESLLKLCQELTVEAIESKYKLNGKKGINLSTLFEDKWVKDTIQSYIDSRLIAFFEKVKHHELFLCYDLKRTGIALDYLCKIAPSHAIPKLFFKKSQTGIRYSLTLIYNDQIIAIHKHKISILTNWPAYILFDNHISQVPFINAAKLKPFLKADSVFISEKLIFNYFNQFIKQLIGNVDIETEGFSIVKYSDIKQVTLIFFFNIFKNKWEGDLVFDYTITQIPFSSPSKRKTIIDFNEQNDISIKQCERNIALEDHYILLLTNLGCTVNENKHLEAGKETFDFLQWCQINQKTISAICTISQIESDAKIVKLYNFEVVSNVKFYNDWFDIHGILVIGNDEYPISRLFHYIKTNNKFFKLRDGTYALIPEALFTRFDSLVKFVKSDGNRTTLSKQHHHLLDDADLRPKDFAPLQEYESLDYNPSPLLKATLRPYQTQGVKWLINHRVHQLGACLADDMGLGKTLQTIAALLHAKEEKKISHIKSNMAVQLDLFGEMESKLTSSLNTLIILPASLVFNWYAEIKKYAPSLHVLNYTGDKRAKVRQTIPTFDIILTTYQTVNSDIDFLQTMEFFYVVLDESQYIRNKNSKIFQSVNQISAKYKISLSGTPIENSLSDLWAQMEFINPSILGSYSFFKENYLIPIEKQGDVNAVSELKKLVDPYILRRTKEQVAKDLPALSEVIHYSEMTENQWNIYEKEKSAARNFLLGLDRNQGKFKFHALASLMKLRQLANHPYLVDRSYAGDAGKFEDIVDSIATVIKSNHKLLVFSGFIEHLALLGQWMDRENIRYVTLKGDMDQMSRKNAVEQFQAPESQINVFLLSIKAGGTGLNLTAADYVFIIDPWWNPFVEKQAIARAHRIGQNKNVMVTRFISKNTLEEKIITLQEKKKKLSDEIIELNEWEALNDEELIGLLD